MVLRTPRDVATRPLDSVERPIPEPAAGEVLVRVEACGVCRTDLHVVEGELAPQRPEIVPGHQIVGHVERCGAGVTAFAPGDRVGVAWLARACGVCRFCTRGDENLCVAPRFTGWHVDGGYAEWVCAAADFVYALDARLAARDVAPLLCAGIIGYRAFVRSRVAPGGRLGLWGFGASAHIVIQLARHHGCEVFAFSRAPAHADFARALGAAWAGGSADVPPAKLDAAIVFAPAGELVPIALERLERRHAGARRHPHERRAAARLRAPSLPGAHRDERDGEHARRRPRAPRARGGDPDPHRDDRLSARARERRARGPEGRSHPRRRGARGRRGSLTGASSSRGRAPGRLRAMSSLHRFAALSFAALLAAGSASAVAPGSIPVGPNSVGPCSGAAITPTIVLQGQFPVALMGSYVMVPFEVPPGTTQVRVKYCWEPPDGAGKPAHTVDLGVWQARDGDAPWGEPQFRGWGGSSHPDVAISAQGFSTEEEYLADPKGYVPGRTTRGFLPGPIPSGTWAVELGVAAVVSQAEGDEDGLTDWRVEIELSSDPAFAADPYVPAPYDSTPASADPGWYAGDLHVHGEHSALGNATMTDVFAYAFTPIASGGAGLDFISLTDYVTSSAWGEVGRYQPQYPGKLIIRGTEVITYHGHCMNHASVHYVDHRTGPVYELANDGTLALLRATHPPAEIFAEVLANGGFTQVNHPTHCPSDSAYCRRTCRGCPWDYSAADTDYERVDGIEVQSGSLFMYTLWSATALQFWQNALDSGAGVAAIGVSDSHTAGVVSDGQASPIGSATTVVYAPELSEAGIEAGVRAAHTYVKVLGNAGPDLRLEVAGDSGGSGIMGDAIPDLGADLTATVLNLDVAESTHTLSLVRDNVELESVDVDPPGIEHVFRAGTPGHYRVQLRRPDGTIVALTSAVTVPEPAPLAGGALALVALAARRRQAGGKVRTWKKPNSIVWRT
jgi:propanol-preferring alcohol dehydrogenase